MKEHNLLWLLKTDKENEENFNYLIRLMKRNVVVPFWEQAFQLTLNIQDGRIFWKSKVKNIIYRR